MTKHDHNSSFPTAAVAGGDTWPITPLQFALELFCYMSFLLHAPHGIGVSCQVVLCPVSKVLLVLKPLEPQKQTVQLPNLFYSYLRRVSISDWRQNYKR